MATVVDVGHFDIGSERSFQVAFEDDAGSLFDPPSVIARVLAPGAPTPTQYTYGVDPQITRISLGTYKLKIDMNAADVWRAGMQSSSPKITVDWTFTVDGSPLGWT